MAALTFSASSLTPFLYCLQNLPQFAILDGMKNYKTVEWQIKPNTVAGRVIIRNNNLENHEKETIYHLASFGYDIEVLAPSNMPGTNNPDLLMMGTFWEMKAPEKNNIVTLETKFRKAVKQSGGKAIFDLRFVENGASEVEKNILALFEKTRGMRRVIIIKKEKKTTRTIDIMK